MQANPRAEPDTVGVATPTGVEEWALAVSQHADRVSVTATPPSGAPVTGEGIDLWDALLVLRRQLEDSGCRLLVNAARVDAFASGMARDMGGGASVYLLRPGRPASTRDLVDSLAPAPEDRVGTVEEQEAFYERYLRSPKKPWWRFW